MVNRIEALFGVKLRKPQYIAERSEIVMEYEHDGIRLDLSSSGQGLQQTLLLLRGYTVTLVPFSCWMSRTPTWKYCDNVRHISLSQK